ncbi:MAG: hypothetical protein ABIT37_20920 [Luteolibacter sp.]
MKALSSAGFLVGGLIIGILLGRGAFPPGAGPRANTEPESARVRPTKSDRPAVTGSSLAGVGRIRQAGPSELPSITQQVATMSDPIESRRLVSECLLNMTADNWREMIASFGKISATSGRDPADDWKLALFRSGQVAGAEAMDSYLSTGIKGNECWQTLYGWSTKDPQAALAWLKKAEAEGHATSGENYTAVISGLALSSPQEALKLLDGMPAGQRKDCAGNFVWNVVQNGGTDALDPVLQYASTLNASESGNAQLSDDLFREATEKLLWKADHARDVGQACEVMAKLAGYGRDPNDVTRTVLRKYRWYVMPDKLTILESASTGPQGSQLELASLTSSLMSTMNGSQDQAAVREWMKSHPDSPLIPHLKTRISVEP